MHEARDYSDLLEQIASFDGAQEALREALHDVHSRRRVIDDGQQEIMPYDYQEAEDRLRFILCNLPKDVESISINTRFQRVKEPHLNVEYLTRGLLYFLEQLDPDLKDRDEIAFEFVVRPNVIPDELKKLSHGSRARDLATEVVETVRLGYEAQTHVFVIEPHGVAGENRLAFLHARAFFVPLRFVEDIALYKDQKLLTPYLQGTNPEALQRIPVQYS